MSIALKRYLMLLTPFLEKEGVTEICINRPKEIFVEKNSTFARYDVAELEQSFLEALASLVAEYNDKEFPAPLLAGSLPTGERVQFVMNPACENGNIVCSIRKHHMHDLSLDCYDEQGVFEELIEDRGPSTADEQLISLYHQKRPLEFIKFAIACKKNILISGGTGTGKTTFLNACLKEIPAHERLITVEDTREVKVEQQNRVHLLFNEDDERITSLKVFKTCLRLRPDRIFLSELRGAEVWPYLRAANSGHPGSLSTVHADTPKGAITQLIFMMQQAGSNSDEENLRSYIKSIIDIVVQLKRDPSPDRFMNVSDIYFNDNED